MLYNFCNLIFGYDTYFIYYLLRLLLLYITLKPIFIFIIYFYITHTFIDKSISTTVRPS